MAWDFLVEAVGLEPTNLLTARSAGLGESFSEMFANDPTFSWPRGLLSNVGSFVVMTPRPKAETEAKLLAVLHDHTDFESWCLSFSPRLVAALFLVIGDWPLAEEAANEAFARAFLRWSHIKNGNVEGWTFVVGRNYLRHVARRRRLETERLPRSGLITQNQDMFDMAASVAERIDLLAVLQSLPPRTREVVVMHYLLDLTQEDIARRLRIKRSTVASALHELRGRIGAQQGTENPKCEDES